MANRRCFSVKICQSARFLNMSAGAQALYLAILGDCDDDGIFYVERIKRLANRRKQDVDQLISNGYISIIDKRLNVGYVIDWQAFNSLDARYSTPSAFRQTLIDVYPNMENALFKPKKPAPHAGITRISQVKLNQVKKREVKTKEYAAEFEPIWKIYPRKEGKKNALQYYSRSRKAGASAEEITAGVKRYDEKMKYEKRESQYIKTGGNFFREELWKESHEIKRDPELVENTDIFGDYEP